MIPILLASLIIINCYAITVHEQLQKLTLDEKIGQLFMIAAVSDEETNKNFMNNSPYTMDHAHVEKMIKEYHIGGIIFAGRGTPEKQIERTRQYQKLSKTPLLIAQDLEWGLAMRLENVIRFPRAMTLGAIQDNALIYAMAKEVGRQAQLLGVHMNFAPVVDVNNNPLNPIIHDRSFGDNPELVARKALAFMRGLRDAGIIACAKHFPGHGDTCVDSHHALPFIPHSLDRLHSIELAPFKHMIIHDVPAIMVAHLEVPALEPEPGVPTSLSYAVVTQLLKQHLGFKGLVLPDGLGMRAITNHYKPGELELKALLAGHDIILMPVDVPKAVAKIKAALTDGQITQQDIDARVLKILTAKEWSLTHNNNAFNPLHDPAALTTPAGVQLQERLYQEALTIARDSNTLLPLAHNSTILYLQYGETRDCDFASMLQKQYAHITTQYISPQETQEYTFPEHADQTIIIALFSMNKRKHIEESGSPQMYGITHTMLSTIKKLSAQTDKIILVIFGSPYSIPLFEGIKTIVVAYEDDPSAQKAAANLLAGTITAHAKLPIIIT